MSKLPYHTQKRPRILKNKSEESTFMSEDGTSRDNSQLVSTSKQAYRVPISTYTSLKAQWFEAIRVEDVEVRSIYNCNYFNYNNIKYNSI